MSRRASLLRDGEEDEIKQLGPNSVNLNELSASGEIFIFNLETIIPSGPPRSAVTFCQRHCYAFILVVMEH